LHVGQSPAHAEVPKLVTTGVNQATAAPVPIRFSILRRDIRSGLSSFIQSPPFGD
jgi:hypothetical protein